MVFLSGRNFWRGSYYSNESKALRGFTFWRYRTLDVGEERCSHLDCGDNVFEKRDTERRAMRVPTWVDVPLEHRRTKYDLKMDDKSN